MTQMFPFLTDDSRALLNLSREPVRLGELMKTSEQGFGRSDAAMHDTFDVASEWNRLLLALEKLEHDINAEVSAV